MKLPTIRFAAQIYWRLSRQLGDHLKDTNQGWLELCFFQNGMEAIPALISPSTRKTLDHEGW